MKPSLQYLSQEEVEQIHETALDLLENTGMRMPYDVAQDYFKNAGCKVEDDIVYVNRDVVKKALETLPGRDNITLYARDEKYDINFEKDSPALAAMVEATQVLDMDSGKKRPATNEDLAIMSSILQRLDNVSLASPPVTPQDVPQDITDWYTWATSLSYTTKHITGPAPGKKSVQDTIKMASIAAGSEEEFLERPFLSFWILTTPPMKTEQLTLEALIEASKYKIPLIVSSGPITGVTAPVTIAGSAAMAHAEILSCLTLSQLVNPGAPAIYTSFARSFDMKTGNISMASPEFAILKVCLGQMGDYLGLPTRMPAMLRDSKVVDAQAGFETGITGMASGLAADIMDGMQLDMDKVVDYADFVYCDECMAQVKRLARPVDVNEKTLAKDVVFENGQDGNYLRASHTVKNFRKEIWMPKLFERRTWTPWEDDGAMTIREKALKKTKEMVEEGVEPVLDSESREKLEEIARQGGEE
ncbi:trimethylamine methyltransferase family protein [Natranaerofaba carboxydovora]|uniref:trimethylamine methyltransferase family protein n=1 Tax=Natranaerofaba carboxydovora TaxID=2742683 RepID=UPI001F131CFF|nr:trimethylamine methyltransferase family protein [Natranaerofaba carboxydovora]UMZ74790.1 Trimethylamine methyltransferase (MTTB) [Natranaerofaba carboxydovora]